MAGAVVTGHSHHRHNTSIVAMEESGRLASMPPAIVMVPNPTFSFPMKPDTSTTTDLAILSQNATRRPVSMHLSSLNRPTDPSAPPHKRTASALPSFSFNAADTSGRCGDDTPPRTPDEEEGDSTIQTWVRRGHKRGGSEFVGGDSRFGVSNAISTSPVKAVPTGQPGRRNTRHGHQRSAALSVHEINDIMSSTDVPPRLSSSLPTTPLETPVLLPAANLNRSGSASAFEPNSDVPPVSSDDSPVRPSSRPRVEFVDRVEIIPRPLSTISSETEGSLSTIRNHSVNNSISSMISLGAASPSFARTPMRTASESDAIANTGVRSRARSSLEISKRVEREGQWLKNKSSDADESTRQLEGTSVELATTVPSTTFKPAASTRARSPRKSSVGYALGFERRRSEPVLSVSAAEPSRLSAVSLQETVLRGPSHSSASATRAARTSSTHRLMNWARSKLHRKSRDFRSSDVIATQVADCGHQTTHFHPPIVSDKPSTPPDLVAELDLDAVLGSDDSDDGDERLGTPPPPSVVDFNPPTFAARHHPHYTDLDDDSPLVDLDAALEPMRTPPLGPSTQRRQLHSSRSGKTFTGATYQHRRVESEPALLLYQHSRTATPSQTSMEDVDEEDEEDETISEEERYIGVALVDAVDSAFDGLRINAGKWDGERPHSSYITPSRLGVSTMDRPASLVEEVIVEESSPVDASADQIEIVQAHEEPRASSLTKSSDSSVASTLLAAPTTTLAVPKEETASTFTSPDLTRRQGSFEAPRLGTSASSIADNRTMSSSTTGEAGHEVRMSVDDVPSLTSSRSTMMSTMHANNSRRELSEPRPRSLTPAQAAERRKKRASIQSLSQLVGVPFGPKAKASEDFRPQTAAPRTSTGTDVPKRKENRLKKLMFWRPKQASQQT